MIALLKRFHFRNPQAEFIGHYGKFYEDKKGTNVRKPGKSGKVHKFHTQQNALFFTKKNMCNESSSHGVMLFYTSHVSKPDLKNLKLPMWTHDSEVTALSQAAQFALRVCNGLKT